MYALKMFITVRHSLNVQFQKISILPPQKRLEFTGGSGGFCKAKKFKEMYEA